MRYALYPFARFLQKEGLLWDALIILVSAAIIAAPIALIIKAITDGDYGKCFKPTFWICVGILVIVDITISSSM